MQTTRGTDMAKVLVTESYLSDIADAIRAKNGTASTYTPAQMAAAVTALPSGGAAAFPPGGVNASLIETHSSIITLADTNYPSMTMTTSQQTIQASVSGAYVSSYFPHKTTDTIVVQQVFAHHVYNGADGRAKMNNTYRIHYTYYSYGRSANNGSTTRSGTLTFYYLDYLNTSGAQAYASGTYGIYGTASSCSTSASGSNMRVTVASPTWYGRANSTYCKLDNINKLDTTNTKLYWVVDIYSVDQFTTPMGWFVGDQMFDAFTAGKVESLG